jgi:hypothetical protein
MSESAELDIEHDGQSFIVIVDFQTKIVDNSFDGHLGGVVHTFKQFDEEIDFDSVEIVSCTNDEEVEVDPEDVPGLMHRIEYELGELDLNN